MGGLVNAIAKATRRLQSSLTVLEEVPTVGEGWGVGREVPRTRYVHLDWRIFLSAEKTCLRLTATQAHKPLSPLP